MNSNVKWMALILHKPPADVTLGIVEECLTIAVYNVLLTSHLTDVVLPFQRMVG